VHFAAGGLKKRRKSSKSIEPSVTRARVDVEEYVGEHLVVTLVASGERERAMIKAAPPPPTPPPLCSLQTKDTDTHTKRAEGTRASVQKDRGERRNLLKAFRRLVKDKIRNAVALSRSSVQTLLLFGVSEKNGYFFGVEIAVCFPDGKREGKKRGQPGSL